MFIRDMLSEELENSLRIKQDYKEAMDALPKGSLVRKIIGKHPYYYLARRRGSKVEFEYLGKISEEEVKRYEEAKQNRARYRKHVSEADKQIKYLRRVLRAKQPA